MVAGIGWDSGGDVGSLGGGGLISWHGFPLKSNLPPLCRGQRRKMC